MLSFFVKINIFFSWFYFLIILVCGRFINWRYSKEDDSSCMKWMTKTIFPFRFYDLNNTSCSVHAHIYCCFFSNSSAVYAYTLYWYSSMDFSVSFFSQLCLLNLAVFCFTFAVFFLSVCKCRTLTVRFIINIIIFYCVLSCGLVFTIVQSCFFLSYSVSDREGERAGIFFLPLL
jgi:hypothetical protein